MAIIKELLPMKTSKELRQEILEAYAVDYDLTQLKIYCDEQEYDYKITNAGSTLFIKVIDSENKVGCLLQIKISCISL
jgi:hypothetical protein